MQINKTVVQDRYPENLTAAFKETFFKEGAFISNKTCRKLVEELNPGDTLSFTCEQVEYKVMKIENDEYRLDDTLGGQPSCFLKLNFQELVEMLPNKGDLVGGSFVPEQVIKWP